MNKKDIILFISIFCILALIAGGTYAYWEWNSETNKNVVFNTSKGIEEYITYDAGESHFVGDFQTSTSYCGGMSNTISFSKDSAVASETLMATINMDVNYIGGNITSSDAVYWAITSGDSSSCTGSDALHTGSFNGVSTENGVVTIELEEVEITTSTQTFTIWIWIDETKTSGDNISGETIDTNIWTQIDMTSVD